MIVPNKVDAIKTLCQSFSQVSSSPWLWPPVLELAVTFAPVPVFAIFPLLPTVPVFVLLPLLPPVPAFVIFQFLTPVLVLVLPIQVPRAAEDV